MKRLLLATILAAAIISQAGGLAYAATPATDPVPTGPLNITISPVSQELVVKPGGSVTASFRVRNNGLQTERLKTSIKTFSAKGEDGTPQLRDLTAKDDFATWVKPATATFTVEPNVWETYSVVISPPKTAAFGYYYAIDFSRANQDTATKGNTIFTSVDGLILLNVQAPGVQRKAELTEFSTPNRLIEFLPERFAIRMHNSGNVHVAPRGNIYIYKGKQSVGIIGVNDGAGNILPSSNRLYSAIWKDGTPVYTITTGKTKDGKPTDVEKLNWNNFKLSTMRYGKYTAELQMIYNNGQYDVPLTATLDFWVIPWRIIAAAGLVIVFVLAGIWGIFIRPIRSRIKASRRGNGRPR